MFKTNKTLIAQMVLITFLGFALIAPISIANAGTTIGLQGQIDSAEIDVRVNPTTMSFDISPQYSSMESAGITVTNKSTVPVKMTLESVAHKPGSWSPTLITTDPRKLNIVDAQNQARFSLSLVTNDPNYIVAPPAKVTPTGDGSTVDGTTYPVDLGTIADIVTDTGSLLITGKNVTIKGKLETSMRRLAAKQFDAEIVLNFAAAE